MGVHKVLVGGLGYYVTDGRATEDGLIERDGAWAGRAASELGLAGRAVTLDGLVSLTAGVDPRSGEVIAVDHARVRNRAYDVVLAAPKSVSVRFALGDPVTAAAIVDAHDAAVDAVLEYFERHVAQVRQMTSSVQMVRRAHGLAVATFLHRTSRAPDPHLHTHVVVVNLARDAHGRWSALDARALYSHERTAHALYAAHLRQGIARATGLGFRRRADGVIDLAGLQRNALVTFSRRRVEILEESERVGATSRMARSVVADRTRASKDLTTSWAELIEGWRRAAERSGIAPDDLARLGRTHVPPQPGSLHAGAVEEAVATFQHPFVRRQLETALADRAVDGMAVREVERRAAAVLADRGVRRVGTATYIGGRSTGRRIPLGRAEPRFAPCPLVDAIERVRAAIDGAARPDAFDGTGGDEAHRLRSVLDLATASWIATFVSDRGGRAVGVAPTDALAGHLAAVTGIEVRSRSVTSIGSARLLVLFDARSLAPRAVADALGHLERDGGTVLFLDRPGRTATVHRTVDGGRLLDHAGEPSAVEVAGPDALSEAIEREVARWRARDASPLVVAAVGSELCAMGVRVAATSAIQAIYAARAGRGDAAIVVGDARVLGPAGVRAFGGRRTHLAVGRADCRGIDLALERRRSRDVGREIGA